MLQQILLDMYIDPDLLAELDEEQKQILFCKMRQEQKRRWEERECKFEREETNKPKSTKANRKGNNVVILEGADKKPWTWVMGEHPEDVDIDEMIELENIRRARSLVERELKTFAQVSPNKSQQNGPISEQQGSKSPAYSSEESPPLDDESGNISSCSQEASEELPSSPPIPTKPVSQPVEINATFIEAPTSPETKPKETTAAILNPTACVPPNASFSRVFAAKPRTVKEPETKAPVSDNPKEKEIQHFPEEMNPIPSPSSSSDQPAESTNSVEEIQATADDGFACSEISGRNSNEAVDDVTVENKVPDEIETEKAECPRDKVDPTKKEKIATHRRPTDDSNSEVVTSGSADQPKSPASPIATSVSETIAKLNIRASAKKSSNLPTPKPLERFGQVSRASSAPKSVQNEPPNSAKEEEKNREARERLGKTSPGSVVEKAKLDINQFRQRRMKEIVTGIQSERQKSLERATKDSKNIVQLWLAQEKKAKEADEERKMIARRVREDNARAMRRLRTESQVLSLFTDDPTDPTGYSIHRANDSKSAQRVQRPRDAADATAWYQEVELKRGAGLDPKTGSRVPYYYGMLSRKEAERKLAGKPEGTFLVRLSAQIFGYAISLRGTDSFHNIKNIRHYLIEVTNSGYQFFGANQPTFRTLDDFIGHYKKKPLSLVASDRLMMECGLIKEEEEDDDDDDDNNGNESSSSSDSVLDC